jgi:hypothetical protein
LYRVDFDKAFVRKAMRSQGEFSPGDFTLETLRELRRQGMLVALDNGSHRSWAADTVRVGGRRRAASIYLYSPWQLLKLNEIRLELPVFRVSGRAGFERRYSAPAPTAFAVLHLHQWIFVALSALEPVFYPEIVLVTKGQGPASDDWFERFERWRSESKASRLAGWLRLEPDQLLDLADALAIRTHFFDPLRDWIHVVRLVHPSMWDKLIGEARLAMDHRIAAEAFYRIRDELAREGVAPPVPDPPKMARSPRSERLNHPRETLDRVLMDFGLSPEPSLVWALEGRTEMLLVSLVMDYFEVARHRSFIHLHDVGGNTKDYNLLAQYISVPSTGDTLRDDFVLLDRPITRFLISTDPENKLKSAGGRADKKKQIVDSMVAMLDRRFQTDALREQLEGMVSIEVWTDRNCGRNRGSLRGEGRLRSGRGPGSYRTDSWLARESQDSVKATARPGDRQGSDGTGFMATPQVESGLKQSYRQAGRSSGISAPSEGS